MKKSIMLFCLIAIAIVILGSFLQNQEVSQENGTTDRDYYSPEIQEYLDNLTLPGDRKFAMGFTSHPYDFNEKAYQDTYQKVRRHGDLLAFHLDWGVPWQQALAGKDHYHPEATKIIQDQIAEYRPQQIRYVSTTPQAHDRLTLAPYWGYDTMLELPKKWQQKTFDDPEVIQAYLNWCRFLLRTYQPDYFNYGIEVNYSFEGLNDTRFQAYLKLVQTIYPQLKAEFPDVQLILEFVDRHLTAPQSRLFDITRKLLPYTDVIGISTYPYFKYDDPDDIAHDWLKEMANLDPTKPIAVTETGYAAESIKIPSIGLNVQGTVDKQMRFTQKLLSKLDELDTEFVIWWGVQDTSQAALKIYQNAGHDIAASLWKDIGMYDAHGNKRPSLDVWEQWMMLTKQP